MSSSDEEVVLLSEDLAADLEPCTPGAGDILRGCGGAPPQPIQEHVATAGRASQQPQWPRRVGPKINAADSDRLHHHAASSQSDLEGGGPSQASAAPCRSDLAAPCASDATTSQPACLRTQTPPPPQPQLVEMSTLRDTDLSSGAPFEDEFSPFLPLPGERRFDRSGSYSAAAAPALSTRSSTEIHALEASADAAAQASAEALQQRHLDPQPAFEAFQVEEQATEVKFLKVSLSKKHEECEHLRSIIKELSESRHKLQSSKVQLEESFGGLQREYMRVVKVADLARTVSAQSMNSCVKAKSQLKDAQDGMHRNGRHAERYREQCRRLKSENAELKRTVALLQQLPLSDVRMSASLKEYIYCASGSNLY